MLDAMPVTYAVTYIFGTVGSAIVLALFGPALLNIDLEAESNAMRSERARSSGGAGTAWHNYELRAYKVKEGGKIAGLTLGAEGLLPSERIFIERIRSAGVVKKAPRSTL